VQHLQAFATVMTRLGSVMKPYARIHGLAHIHRHTHSYRHTYTHWDTI